MSTHNLFDFISSARPTLPTASMLVAVLSLADCGMAKDAPETPDNAALFERLDADHDGQIAATEVADTHRRLFDRLVRKADKNNDGTLTRNEFASALAPSRPEKLMEAKLPTSLPEADAARWLLLKMDVNRNGWIEKDEVPEAFLDVFASLADRLDSNKNSVLETQELYRGGPRLSQVAIRYVRQNRINVDKELSDLRMEQGDAVKRFEERRGPLESLADPEQARQTFDRLDANRDGQLASDEVPEPIRRPMQRILRLADRDGDGRLSRREFLAGARKFAARRDAKPANSTPKGPDALDRTSPKK